MSENPALLVLTTDPDLRRRALAWNADGIDVHFYEDAAEALSAARKLDVWVFLVDARNAAPSEGLLRRMRSAPSNPEVLLLLSADAAIPPELSPESFHVERGDLQSLQEPLQRLLRLQIVRHRSGIVGSTPAMRALLSTIVQVAPLDVPVLIQGESGTGKEMVARALHEGSRRDDRPFVSINVGSLAETLLESELFGHEKGAFTGAVARREGVFERANGGTLFLDEVGEMSPAMQVKLLRVLETSEFLRVGGTQPLRTDIRLLAATHRNLEDEMAAGRFREDLYYRLKVVKIEIPPLRERVEDIPALVNAFLTEVNAKHGLSLKGVTREVMERFVRYAWPGNVRQLRNVVSSMAVLAQGEYLGLDDLPDDLVESHRGAGMPVPLTGHERADGSDPLLTSTLLAILGDVRQVLQRLDRLEARLDAAAPHRPTAPVGWDDAPSDAEFTPVPGEMPRDLAGAERAMIEEALRQTHGNRRKAAERLGISERTLYRKLKSYGLH
jgi:DNA-binding NtrC family response regulator